MNRVSLGVALAATVFVATEATAGPINVVASRWVKVGAENLFAFGSSSPSAALGGFNDSIQKDYPLLDPEVVTAEQNTNIDVAAGQFSGTGRSSVGFSVLDSDNVYAVSFFDVDFELLTDHYYDLHGTLDAGMDGGFGEALFILSGPTGQSFSSLNVYNFLSSGTLLAGTYHLNVSSEINNGGSFSEISFMGGFSEFDFELLLTPVDVPGVPVPEPGGTLVLLGSSLVALTVRRRLTRRP
jgi:hypothetical protein